MDGSHFAVSFPPPVTETFPRYILTPREKESCTVSSPVSMDSPPMAVREPPVTDSTLLRVSLVIRTPVENAQSADTALPPVAVM